ncbi:MAG: hypothetical protein HOM55_04940 [Proteobacteria bacterium]|jgi:hypothetical protein|nr:hypothetical protein [Pseudomonadota bacterium]
MVLNIEFHNESSEEIDAGDSGSDPYKDMPAWACVAGYDSSIAWIAKGAITKDSSALRMLEVPTAGEHYTLQVNYPFRLESSEDFWALFQPWNSAINGWEDHPNELELSCIVKCKPVEIIKKTKKLCWLLINVQSLIPFRKITEKIGKGSGGLPLYPVSRMAHVVWSDLNYFDADLEGDISKWFICQKKGQQHTLLIYGTSEWQDSYFYAGNRPLSIDEFENLKKDFVQ